MKLKNQVIFYLLSLFVGIILSTVGCKKGNSGEISTPIGEKDPPSISKKNVTLERSNLTKDSIFLYAKQIYYWSDALPSYEVFNPRKYSLKATDLENYENELFDITQLKINHLTGLPYEYYSSGISLDSKFSYIADLTNRNPIAFVKNERSAVDLEGNGNDLGIKVGAYGSDYSFNLYLIAVSQNSPADKAGLKRGDRVSKINGTTIGSNFNSQSNLINSLNTLGSASLGIVKANGSTVELSLVKSIYKSSPVYKYKTFTADGKKIGYFALARFSDLSNSQPEIDAAFAKFSADGVKDLIIDLRYNGGGYLTTAEYLVNQIATTNLTGNVMYSETYNPLMQAGQATILSNQPVLDADDKVQYLNGKIATYTDIDYSIAGNTQHFQKTGPLNTVSNIVFIISGSTASASELVINSLKPYKNVKLVGEKSYGKPVGFFPIRIENRYDVFMALFSTKNSLGEGEYYDGFTPDVTITYDDPTHDFGDAAETRTAAALNILVPGAVVTGKTKTMSIGGEKVIVQNLPPAKQVPNSNEFNGMIKNKFKFK